MSADLVTWFRACLDEDQRVAEAVRDRTPWRYSPRKYWRGQGIGTSEEAIFTGPAGRDAICICGTGEVDHPEAMARAVHIARWDPARVLAEVAAKRAILGRLVHDGGWELRHGVEGDEIVTYYWSTCSCGWEQEVYRNGDIEDAHDRHRESVGYDEAVADDVVRALAQPFASRAGFDPSWLD